GGGGHGRPSEARDPRRTDQGPDRAPLGVRPTQRRPADARVRARATREGGRSVPREARERDPGPGEDGGPHVEGDAGAPAGPGLRLPGEDGARGGGGQARPPAGDEG